MIALPYIGIRHRDDIRGERWICDVFDLIGWALTVIGLMQSYTHQLTYGSVKVGLVYDLPDLIRHGRVRSIQERYAELRQS